MRGLDSGRKYATGFAVDNLLLWMSCSLGFVACQYGCGCELRSLGGCIDEVEVLNSCNIPKRPNIPRNKVISSPAT